MNHGNLGILHYGTFSADTYLRLPLDTLRPLSIGMGTILTGVHYPPPAGHVGQNDHGVTPDFMLTPIPYELWPRVIRARVRMKHEPGTLHEVSQILADQGFSIHHGEATRSAHRYCSWNLVVSADIPDEDLSYEESKCIYKPTRKWMKRIEKNLSESVEAVFLDSHNERLTRGAMAWPLNSLAYFHYLCETGVISEPFKLHCQDHGRLTSRPHDGFSKLVQYLRGADKSEDACVFAEMDTADVNLRVAIIPEAERSRFVHARLDYRKTVAPGEKCGTNGFLAKITDKLPATMNLWKMSTNTQDSGGGGETGGKRFLIECPNEDDAESMVKDVFKSIAAQKENGWEVFADAQVISYRGVETMLDEQSRADVDYEFQYDVFLSYSHRDNEEASDIEDEFKAAGIRYFRAPKEVQPGDDFVETIRTGLTASRELCLLYTPNAAESEWVSTEWGAAWALQKKITAVLIGIPPDELPQRLSSIQCVQRHKLDEYIEAIIERRGSFHMS